MSDQDLEAHRPEAIQARLARGPEQSYLHDAVYGAIDGAVTTFAVVSGVGGADLGASVLLILGVANLVADGFSMAVGNYLSSRAEVQRWERTRAAEAREVERHPGGEIEEIRQIFAAKGLSGEALERVVAVITADRERWIQTMLREEHGLAAPGRRPERAAWVTFLAFLAAGSVPLLAFAVDLVAPVRGPFVWSSVLTGCAFFGVGALKARFVDQAWWRGGAETLALGACAAGLAWAVGVALAALA